MAKEEFTNVRAVAEMYDSILERVTTQAQWKFVKVLGNMGVMIYLPERMSYRFEPMEVSSQALEWEMEHTK